MAARSASDMHRPPRLAALLQMALLTLSLFAAPALHRQNCTGACAGHDATASGARPAAAAAGSHAAARAGAGCCYGDHAESGPTGPGATRGEHDSGGCGCLDDCCTLFAQGTTPDVVRDAGPATVLVSRALRVAAPALPRAPHARLLPYPTGPPPGA